VKEKDPGPLTKTRLRRGKIARKKPEASRYGAICDFLTPSQAEVENLLYDLSTGSSPAQSGPNGPGSPAA